MRNERAWIEMNEVEQTSSLPTMESMSKTPYESSESKFLLEDPAQGRKNDTHQGWKRGVLVCAWSTLAVFLINLILLIIAVAKHGIGPDGQQMIYDGSCSHARPLNIGIHLIINALSTILLSASNYCMQCLSAPTREDVDKAHARKWWVDVGIPSFRNLRRIGRGRVLLWALLGLSSLPLHLFYNSVVFSSIASNSYTVLPVNEAFVTSTSANFTDPYHLGGNTFRGPTVSKRMWGLARTGALQRLDLNACIDAYAEDFVTSRGDVLLIMDTSSNPKINASAAAVLGQVQSANSIADCNRQDEQFPWICSQQDQTCSMADYQPCQNRIGEIKANSTGWRPVLNAQYPVQYCLSEIVGEHCKVQLSFYLSLIVIILNAIKFAIMCYVALRIKDVPLMTMGDAVVSFLAKPDTTTENMCLLTKDDVRKRKDGYEWSATRTFNSKPRRWLAATSRRRWALCISIYSISLITCIALLAHGLAYISDISPTALTYIWHLGLGAINPLTFIRWNIPSTGVTGLISNVLVANTPQLILSLLYFTYNGLFTAMYLALEWSQFALHRKGLRISTTPSGEQRSTHFLSLPLRIAIPLMVFSGILHWLVSQSIFLAVIESYSHLNSGSGDDGPLLHSSGFDVMTCGWSPVGIVATVLTGTALVLFMLGMGWRRLGSGIPVVGSCSAGISAACHGCQDGQVAGEKRVKWGVLKTYEVGGLEHCGFSAEEVESPVDGIEYR